MSEKGYTVVGAIVILLFIIGGIMQCSEKKKSSGSSDSYVEDTTYETPVENSVSESKDEGIYGTWYYNGGIPGYVIFNKNGICEMKSGDYIAEVEYSVTNSQIILDGQPMSYKLDGDNLIIEGEVYTR